MGNHLRLFELRFNTEAEDLSGAANSAGEMAFVPQPGNNTAPPQTFSVRTSWRATVELTATDNWAGQPGINAGGDRVGRRESPDQRADFDPRGEDRNPNPPSP
ncbi:MAG: hypothetical protein R3F11_14125 [Verrucomicrobiales bacterium]